MSGILNWMIEGLHRLIKNNGFTKTKSSEETKIEFQKLSDTTGAFLNECCEHFKEGVYIKRDLYEIYKKYCDDEGLECDQLSRFSTKMNSQPWIKSGRIRVEKKLEHVWIGLKVKTSSEEEEEKENKKQQKLDTTVPPVPPFIPPVTFEDKEEGIGKRIKKGGTPGTGGTLEPDAIGVDMGNKPPGSGDSEENLIAAYCKKWHTGACTFPGDPNCVVPTNPCPKTCPNYEANEGIRPPDLVPSAEKRAPEPTTGGSGSS
jgi:hypothetical protein